LDINPRFEELFGYSLEEIKGKHINEIVVPENLIAEAESLDKRAEDGYVYHNTARRRKDGTEVPVAVSAAPIVVEDRTIGYVAMYKDISDLKAAERKLETMNEKLRVVGRLARHDVRNKLAVVSGNAFLLRKRLSGDGWILGKIEEIETAVELATQIFEFAKGYESLGVEDVIYMNVHKTFDEAASMFPHLREIKVTNNCSGLTVLADSLLTQMFYNLIDNSLKHGMKVTHIEVHYERTNPEELKLCYEDDGVGVAGQTKPELFREGFTTGNGTGYGLFLVRKIMEVYGWTIREIGEPGRGVKFVITIPKENRNGRLNYQFSEIS
jgi:PAS domain S-box-containing protein